MYGERVACPLHNWSIELAERRPPSRRTWAARIASRCASSDGVVLRRASAGEARVNETRSTCPYCGVGCGVVIEHDGGAHHRRARRPRSSGELRPRCARKGRTLHLTAAPQAHRPRGSRARCAAPPKGQPAQPVTWDAALDDVADRFAACIREHGPDSVAFYVSGQLLTEDYYVFNKLAKGLIGTNNIDTNSRLCMSSAVAGYKQTLGADAPPACYDDIDHARLPVHRRLEHGVGASDPVPPHRGRAGARSRRCKHRRRRSAPHRHRGGAPTCTSRSSPAPTSRCSTACCTCMLWEDLVDRDFIAAHTAGLRRAQGDRARVHAARRRADLRHRARTTSSRPRAGSRQAPTLSLYCQGLNQSTCGHREERGAHQPAPRDRPDRQARRRAVLADRPAQRDGRPRSRRPREPAVRRIATSPIPRIAPKSPRCGASTDVPATAGPHRGRAVRRAGAPAA